MELDDARVNFTYGDPLDLEVLGFDLGHHLNDGTSSVTVNLGDELDGFTIGGGAEVKLGGPESRWSLKGEYRFTSLGGDSGRATVSSSGCPLKVHEHDSEPPRAELSSESSRVHDALNLLARNDCVLTEYYKKTYGTTEYSFKKEIDVSRDIETTAKADLDADLHTFRAVLVYRFGGGDYAELK
jgi:hypothetical protein